MIDLLGNLPCEIQLEILSYLNPKELSLAAKVCRSWNEIASCDPLWQKFITSEVPQSLSSKKYYALNIGGRRIRDISLSRHYLAGTWGTAIVIWNKIFNIYQAPIVTMTDHQDAILSFAMKMDGLRQYIITGSEDKSIKIWRKEGDGFALEKTLIGHLGPVLSVQGISKQIFSGSSDTTIKIWNQTNGLLEQTLEGHQGPVTVLCLYQYLSHCLISGSMDKTIRIWEMCGKKHRCRHILTGHEEAVSHLLHSAEKKQLYSGSIDGTIRIWRGSITEGFTQIERIQAHRQGITALHLFKSGFCSSGDDKVMKIWVKKNINGEEKWFSSPVSLDLTHSIVSIKSIKTYGTELDQRFLVATKTGILSIYYDQNRTVQLIDISPDQNL